MGYLEEFQLLISNHDTSRLLQLWEEYCSVDEVDGPELRHILEIVKGSELANTLGQYVELALPLWQRIEDDQIALDVVRLIIDLETTNSAQLAETAYQEIKQHYGQQTYFNDKIRLVGLRNREHFQGAIRNYELLTHMDRGKFVFHTGGWGTGEIMDYSLVREELILEFENVGGRKFFSFENAFKHLVALPNHHFLARRFGNPDQMEKDAKADPAGLIRDLLRDLGPKNAGEIKDELCELVIPSDDWSKWWQLTRTKIKKDTMVETPANLKLPFRLRKSEEAHAERFRKAIETEKNLTKLIPTTYNFVRDFPEILKDEESKKLLKSRLEEWLQQAATDAHRFQLLVLFETIQPSDAHKKAIADFVEQPKDFAEIVNQMEVIAYKKRALVAIREHRNDWTEIFFSLFYIIQQNPLRDYILKELMHPATAAKLEAKLDELIQAPSRYPESFVWYFQKILENPDIPFADQDGRCLFFEGLLILLSAVESNPNYRELTKKIQGIISGKRFEIVRKILEGSSWEFAKEFLLLVTKCHTLSDHDVKILHSLAEVAHPDILGTSKHDKNQDDPNTIWTTEEGFKKAQERLSHIGTVETVENAKEIEAARELGDLRENSEYKFALERRARLQAQMKIYSEQLRNARIISKEDIHLNEVGVGSKVELTNSHNKTVTYTILGPWDADPDQNILSHQSKLAKAMEHHVVGDTIEFGENIFTIKTIKSYLDA